MLTKNPQPSAVFPAEYAAKMLAAAREFNLATARQDNLWTFDHQSRKDAAELAFVARQLEVMRPGIYEVKYPDLLSHDLIPYNNSVDTGAEQYTATLMDEFGDVRVSRDMGGDTPMVGVTVQQGSVPIFSLRNGYEYSLQEARNAAYGRFPLIPKKAMKARELMERKIDDIAFVGDAATGVKGLLTLTGVEVYTVPSDGTGGSKTFESKGSDEVLRDLNAPTTQIVTNTKGIEIADTMILPFSTYNGLVTRRIGDGTSQTILKYFLDNTPYITTVAQTYKTESNGQWTGKRGIVYRKDPQRLEMIVPQPFEQLAPQFDGFMVRTLCHARTAGVQTTTPHSICVFDGI